MLAADAELAHQGEHVGLEPRGHDLPAGELADRHLAEVDALPRRGDPEQLALVRSGLAEAAHDQILLGHHVFDGHVEVGERVAEDACHLLAALGSHRKLRCIGRDRRRMEELVGEVVVAVVPDRELARHQPLVLLDRRLTTAGDDRDRRHGRRLLPARDHAELLQELGRAEALPPCGDLALRVQQAEHDRRGADADSGRLDTHERSEVGARRGDVVDGLVALDHGVQQLHLEVGEGAAEELDDLFHALAVGRKPGQRVVVDEVGSE